MSRIYWTAEESNLVALRTALLMRKQGIHIIPDKKDREGSSFLMTAVRQAQIAELQPARRREFMNGRMGLKDSFWESVLKFIRLPISNEELESRIRANQPVRSTTPTVQVSQPPAEPEQKSVAVEKSAPGDAVEGYVRRIDEFSTEELVLLLVRRLSEELSKEPEADLRAETEKLSQQVAALTSRISELAGFDGLISDEIHHVRQQQADLVNRITALSNSSGVQRRKPRVAIVGCQKYEFDNICKKVEDLDIDLKHYSQDEKPKTVHADWALIMKHSSHMWSDHVTNNVARGQYQFVTGASSAAEQLRIWFK